MAFLCFALVCALFGDAFKEKLANSDVQMGNDEDINGILKPKSSQLKIKENDLWLPPSLSIYSSNSLLMSYLLYTLCPIHLFNSNISNCAQLKVIKSWYE